MELIKKWLSGNRNFIVGAVLYKKFGTDDKLKKLFEGKADPYLQQRLEQELSALLEKPKVVLQETAPKGDGAEMPESSDPVLKALRQEWLPLYQRMNYLRHELDRYPGNSPEEIAARSPIAGEVLELEQKCMVVWERREHYLKNGSLPEVKTTARPIPEDPVDLGTMIESLKRNIRRNKAAARKYPDNPTYPLRAKQYEDELQELLKKGNGHGKG